MMKNTGRVKSGCSRHKSTLSLSPIACQLNYLRASPLLPTLLPTELGDLYFRLHASQFYLFVAPVELKGVSGFVFKGDVGFSQSRTARSFQVANITTDGIVATFVPFALQLLKQELGATAMSDRFAAILIQQFGQEINKTAELGMRLGDPLVLLVGYAASNNISDGVAGKVQFAGYLTNFLPVSKMGTTDFTDGLHVQHLLFLLLSLVDFQRVWRKD